MTFDRWGRGIDMLIMEPNNTRMRNQDESDATAKLLDRLKKRKWEDDERQVYEVDKKTNRYKLKKYRVKKPYAPRAVPSVDKLILEILVAEKLFTREQVVFGVMRRGKNVQARSVYLRLLALVKAGKVEKEGNAKRARYFVRL